jgi:hypothetical protein
MAYAIAALCTALSGAGIAIGAQQTSAPSTRTELLALSPGTRVRLWERAGGNLNIPVAGEFKGLSADTVHLVPAGLATARGIPERDVLRVETSAGPRSAPRLPAAGKGALAGGIGGAILGIIAGNISKRNSAKLGIAGFGVGAVGGGIVGSQLPGELWTPPAH